LEVAFCLVAFLPLGVVSSTSVNSIQLLCFFTENVSRQIFSAKRENGCFIMLRGCLYSCFVPFQTNSKAKTKLSFGHNAASEEVVVTAQ